jgi:hypothetical protein
MLLAGYWLTRHADHVGFHFSTRIVKGTLEGRQDRLQPAKGVDFALFNIDASLNP